MRQFTATVYIIQDNKVLLIFHKKLNKWLPPGGHLDENELPCEGAIREAKEETGLDIELILEENIWINRWNARSFPRPYLCLLEEIPAWNGHPAHQHMDMIYLGKPIGGKEVHNPRESHDIKWFALEEVKNLVSDHEIFEETKQVIHKILTGRESHG